MQFLRSGRFSDVRVLFRGNELTCHWVHLAAKSKLFDSLYDSGLKEDEGVIEIKEDKSIDDSVIRFMIEFCYHVPEASYRDSFGEILQLLVLADKYMMDELSEWVTRAANTHISQGLRDPENISTEELNHLLVILVNSPKECYNSLTRSLAMLVLKKTDINKRAITLSLMDAILKNFTSNSLFEKINYIFQWLDVNRDNSKIMVLDGKELSLAECSTHFLQEYEYERLTTEQLEIILTTGSTYWPEFGNYVALYFLRKHKKRKCHPKIGECCGCKRCRPSHY